MLLCFIQQKVQKALLQSDVQSKSDKSPVTVADYGMSLQFLNWSLEVIVLAFF